MIRVFVRKWWRDAQQGEPGYGRNGLVPNSGDRGRRIARVATEAEAREICKAWNASHKPGRYSRKAEYGDE
jgi:hypothetical protein